MKTFSKTYKNGLRLVLEQKDTDVVSSNILFFVGSENENKEEEGFSHFIEHMIFKSSENYSTEEINDKFTFYGADYNAYTSKTATRFIFKCLKENFEPCFEIYSDLLIRPKFDEEEMNKERNVVVEEMKKCEDDPVQVMYQRVMDNYFSGLSCAHDELGNEETIMSVSRETLLAYKNKFYQANNCIISVVGNIEFDELDRIVEKYFSSCFDYESKHYNLNKEKIQENIIKKYDTI
ncbi:MAG: insulinase family protein, partial [Clostridia bacterium]|nr:insulinase family protein [Clostridia bacterium]